MSRLLVLDTSTETLHLGLTDGARRWCRAIPGGVHASATLLPALMSLLDDAGFSIASLDAIGFGRGPGAFTGVRAACAVTQGLAFGAGLPVLALDSLMAVAEDVRLQGGAQFSPIWVAIDARMGEAYAACFVRDDDTGWHTVEAPALHAPATLAVRIGSNLTSKCAAVAGTSLTAHAPAWTAWRGARWPAATPMAAALLSLAQRAWQRGERLDAADAVPLYVRDKVAQTTAERAAPRPA